MNETSAQVLGFDDEMYKITYDGNCTFGHTRTDNRRGKEYKLELRFSSRLLFSGPGIRVGDHTWYGIPSDTLRGHVCESFSDFHDIEGWRLIAIINYPMKTSGVYQQDVYVKFVREYKKPSQIQDPLDALKEMEVFGVDDAITFASKRFRAAVENARQEFAKEIVAHKKTSFANDFLAMLVNKIVTEAKAECRHNQRLAALNAEVEAEIKVTSEKLIDEFSKPVIVNDEIVPRDIIDAVSKHAEKSALKRFQNFLFATAVSAVKASDFDFAPTDDLR